MWRLFEGVPRVCRSCGKDLKKIEDVGEHRTLYPSNKSEFLCKECRPGARSKAPSPSA